MTNNATENRRFVHAAQRSAEEIFISYFTDPLCAWSWAMEPEWQKLRQALGDRLHETYVMGGLIPDWKTFNDSLQSVSRPLQMGPVWMQISELTNTALDHNIWMRDPPSSSYPACIAFKCAEMQSKPLGEFFLWVLRKAVMSDGQNISKTKVILGLADHPLVRKQGLNVRKFKEDLFNGVGLEAFRKDLELTQRHRISRFPSMVIRKRNKPTMLLSGYKKFEGLLKIVLA